MGNCCGLVTYTPFGNFSLYQTTPHAITFSNIRRESIAKSLPLISKMICKKKIRLPYCAGYIRFGHEKGTLRHVCPDFVAMFPSKHNKNNAKKQ
ncbi:MAG: hypothetical protein CL920_32990 [Deltaproteobacteria bacterium]|nr:hypothetical protein [Deltaproteobacteria bacterium]MBU53539.1 hypothetical protein [Deltaproteobacteria bacterium]